MFAYPLCYYLKDVLYMIENKNKQLGLSKLNVQCVQSKRLPVTCRANTSLLFTYLLISKWC